MKKIFYNISRTLVEGRGISPYIYFIGIVTICVGISILLCK